MIGGNRLPEGLMEEVGSAIRDFELLRAQGFGDSESPLLVSVCSGSMSSTPEMMDTILYIGLNDETVRGLSVINGNQRLAYDCYRQLLQMFGRIVCNIDNNYFEWELQTLKKKLRCKTDSELSESALIELCITYKKIIRKMMGTPFPENVYDQLGMAIEAVFRSWKRDFVYRSMHRLSADRVGAVKIQPIVLDDSGSTGGNGVLITRDSFTGEKCYNLPKQLLNSYGSPMILYSHEIYNF